MAVYDICLRCGYEFENTPKSDVCPKCQGRISRQEKFDTKRISHFEIFKNLVEAVRLLNCFDETVGIFLSEKAQHDEIDARQKLIDLCCIMWGETNGRTSPDIAVDWFNSTREKDADKLISLYQTMTFGSLRRCADG